MGNVFKPPGASRQVAFHQLLVGARKTWLVDALSDVLTTIDPKVLKHQITEYVPASAQKVLAAAGIRDEYVFPVPIVLESKPTLVGYYRLLLGSPQKTFYGSSTGLARFKGMEMHGLLRSRQRADLPMFCVAMCKTLADLVVQISPQITTRDVTELPLLTLGSFFQGQNNVAIGKQATKDVFLTIAEIVRRYIISQDDQQLTVRNASERTVTLALGSDPDVRIQEDFGEADLRNKIAIEIKGGTDMSNAHNRAGEAEKSHQKARRKGYRDFWTIIAKKGLDMTKIKAESPTTTSWFDAAQVLGREGPDWEDFRNRIADAVGIPLRKRRFRSR